jgi:hypothetical protein
MLLVAAGFFLLASAVAPVVVLSVHNGRVRRLGHSEDEFKLLQAATATGRIEDRTLGKLMSFNFRLMDRFVGVALGQARASYISCVVAASVSLLVLLAGVASILTLSNAGAQVSASLLTVAGASLSGYLSVTFMRTYDATSRHMTYYYGQPLVHCYLLHAEWLAERSYDRMDPADALRIRNDLIHATLGASRNAQQQLFHLQRLSGEPLPSNEGFNAAASEGLNAAVSEGLNAAVSEGALDGAPSRRPRFARAS